MSGEQIFRRMCIGLEVSVIKAGPMAISWMSLPLFKSPIGRAAGVSQSGLSDCGCRRLCPASLLSVAFHVHDHSLPTFWAILWDGSEWIRVLGCTPSHFTSATPLSGIAALLLFRPSSGRAVDGHLRGARPGVRCRAARACAAAGEAVCVCMCVGGEGSSCWVLPVPALLQAKLWVQSGSSNVLGAVAAGADNAAALAAAVAEGPAAAAAAAAALPADPSADAPASSAAAAGNGGAGAAVGVGSGGAAGQADGGAVRGAGDGAGRDNAHAIAGPAEAGGSGTNGLGGAAPGSSEEPTAPTSGASGQGSGGMGVQGGMGAAATAAGEEEEEEGNGRRMRAQEGSEAAATAPAAVVGGEKHVHCLHCCRGNRSACYEQEWGQKHMLAMSHKCIEVAKGKQARFEGVDDIVEEQGISGGAHRDLETLSEAISAYGPSTSTILRGIKLLGDTNVPAGHVSFEVAVEEGIEGQGTGTSSSVMHGGVRWEVGQPFR
eukprot:951383-Pelagomonas_calceolata.AAC.2